MVVMEVDVVEVVEVVEGAVDAVGEDQDDCCIYRLSF
jgi:hypothetical protein